MKDISKDIEKTSLWIDITKILESTKEGKDFEIRGMIHTEKEDINILSLTSLDIVRDYSSAIGDNIFIEFKIGLGDYVKRIHPYRNNLEFSIKRLPKNTKDKTKKVKKYKAIFLEEKNPSVSGTDYSRYSTEHLNTTSIVDLQFQLVEISLEVTRVMTVSGIYKNVSREDLIRSILVDRSNQFLINGKPAVDGIDIVKLNNVSPIKQTIIPDGTTISSIPTFIHEKVGGLYNAGIGTYFQTYKDKKLWFVYPVGNTDRFKENVDKIIFYSVPNERLKTIDKTYRIENTITHVAVTGGKSYTDSAELEFMNEGIGYRTSDANAFMKKPVVMTDEGPKGTRSNLNTEVVTKKRNDNLSYAPMVGKNNQNRGITGNQFMEASLVNLRRLARVDVVWENGDIELLYPGMPCKYIFLQLDKTIELKGVVLFAHSSMSVQGNKSTSDIYKSSIKITLAVEPYSDKPIVSKYKPAGKF